MTLLFTTALAIGASDAPNRQSPTAGDLAFVLVGALFLLGLVSVGRTYKVGPDGKRQNALIAAVGRGAKMGLIISATLIVVLTAYFLLVENP